MCVPPESSATARCDHAKNISSSPPSFIYNLAPEDYTDAFIDLM